MAGAGSAGTGKIRVKFLVDNEKRKVVFAESGKEFVDVLLSFLTLPLGTIVRLLGKESSLGCFDELYRSVESLDASHFQTKACRNMLLRPLSAAGIVHEDLVVRIDDASHRDVWLCIQRECVTLLQVFLPGHLFRLPLGPGQKIAFVPSPTASRASGGHEPFVLVGGTNRDQRHPFCPD